MKHLFLILKKKTMEKERSLNEKTITYLVSNLFIFLTIPNTICLLFSQFPIQFVYFSHNSKYNLFTFLTIPNTICLLFSQFQIQFVYFSHNSKYNLFTFLTIPNTICLLFSQFQIQSQFIEFFMLYLKMLTDPEFT